MKQLFSIFKQRSPFTKVKLHDGSPFWIVDGQAYDFTEWMNKHPGGAIWLRWSEGRDISVLLHIYHRNPQKLQKILTRYRIDHVNAQDVLPKMGLPPFLLEPNFNAAQDLPKFNFQDNNQLLNKIHSKVNATISKQQFERWDRGYDLVSMALLLCHVLTLFALVLSWMPAWVCIGLLVLTRTTLSGAGHYYIHRKQPNASQALFDLNYVGTCLIGMDGHVLLHHPHLSSGADVKKTFFNGMLQLHPLLRIPGYTLHKFGVFLLGILLRGYEVTFLERKGDGLRIEFWFVRFWLLFEFIICMISGYIIAWLIQFMMTLWLNTFLVVSGHDFHDDDNKADQLPADLRKDWAALQIIQSYDLSIIGNRWIDSWLSAGLSPHRVHHVLPMQRSAFANLISEPIVRSVCDEANIQWQKPYNFFFNRLPATIRYYLFKPINASESIWREIRNCVDYIGSGFKGIGAI